MKTVFDPSTREALISRIEQLQPDSKPLWGKMTAYQMAKHCQLAEEMFLGLTEYPRSFIGRIFGKMALNSMIKDDKPFMKNAKTSTDFVVTGDGDFEKTKMEWIRLVKSYDNFSKAFITHWFFGKMTRGQVGLFTYKHIDHHLRQFNL
jgi:hypothetical protein